MKSLVFAVALAFSASLAPQIANAGVYALAHGAFTDLADWKDTLSRPDTDFRAAPPARRTWNTTAKADRLVGLNPQPEPPSATTGMR